MAKKKILLLSDDLRLTSGIATVSRDMVLGTLHKYDWVQIGAAINHPDKGKVMNLSEDSNSITGLKDGYVKLYCHDNYGDPFILRRVIKIEKPDAILHFTDPRFWGWLYNMEHEIRTKIPLMYLNIWDGAGLVGDTPTDPMWNADAYSSCDLLMAISKQTYGINHRILTKTNEDVEHGRVTYVPHGINTDIFFPIKETDKDWNAYLEYFKKIRNGNEKKFVIMWNNRNIHRKHPGDVILAYKHLCQLIDKNGGDSKNDCVLFMNTVPTDNNGTDLIAVINNVCKENTVVFNNKTVTPEQLNIFYNASDVVLNLASNEGFGLSTAEALATGTPIVVNVTGGLQDQCGFINPKTNNYFTEQEYIEIHTLHDKYEWGNIKHGEWVKPVWPSNLSLQGSVPTPYIFDDRADYREIGDALYNWFITSNEKRKEDGLKGREFLMKEEVGMSKNEMSKRIISSIENTFVHFKPRKKFDIHLI